MVNSVKFSQVQTATLVVAAALVNGNNRVLLQQRPLTREHGGLWEFPGGKLEPGEGPIAGLIRELQEELAISPVADACIPLGFAAGEAPRPIVLLLYGCRNWHGTPVSQEGAELAWVDPDALHTLPMPPLDVPLVALAARFARDHAATFENHLPSLAVDPKGASPRRP